MYFLNCWLGKNRQTVSWLGISLPTHLGRRTFLTILLGVRNWYFFPATEKNVKKALKALTYHFYGLFVTFCEKVSLSAPVSIASPTLGSRSAERAKPGFVTLGYFWVDMTGSLICFSNLRNRRSLSNSNYQMSIKNPLNLGKTSDWRSFSDSKTVTGSRPKNIQVSQALVSLSQPSMNQDLRLIQLFWIAWQF